MIAFLHSKTVIHLLFGFTILSLSLGMVRGETSLSRFLDLRESKTRLEAAVHKIEVENQQAKDELMRLRKSKTYARKVLRDKYHVTDPDENIIFFAD